MASKCPQCGGQVSASAKACGHCGQWLEPEAESVAPLSDVAVSVPPRGDELLVASETPSKKVPGESLQPMERKTAAAGLPLAKGEVSTSRRAVHGWVWVVGGVALVAIIAVVLVATGAIRLPGRAVEPASTARPTVTGRPAATLPPASTPAPRTAAEHLEAASRYLEQGDCDGTLAEAEQAVSLDDQDPHTIRMMGNAYACLEEYDAAQAYWLQALEMDPAHWRAAVNLANLYYETWWEPDLALDYATQAVENAGGDGWTHWALLLRAKILRDMHEDFGGAVEDLDRAIALEEDAELYIERCVTYNWSGDPWSGVDDCTRAIELDPQPWAYYERAGCYNNMGEYAAALEDGNACVSLDPEDLWCYWHRALAHDGLGDVAAAVADFEQFLDRGGFDACQDCGEHAQTYVDAHAE